MIDISSNPALVEHYIKLAEQLDKTAERIGRRPDIDNELVPKLRNMADEIRRNVGMPPAYLRLVKQAG